MVDKSPAEDKLLYSGIRPWEPKEHKPVLTASRSAYKPYSTYVTPSSEYCISQLLISRQSQEQVHTLAAQDRAPVDQSPEQTATTNGAPSTRKALGNLLCYVNIVRFEEQIQITLLRDAITAGYPNMTMHATRGLQT